MNDDLTLLRRQAYEAVRLYLLRNQEEQPIWRCALFDMDGVLFDSMPAHCRSWLETAHAYGLPMTEDDVYMFEGQTGKQSINILMERRLGRPATDDEVRQIYAHKTDLFIRYNSGALIEGAGDLVEVFSRLSRVLVTGSSQESLLDKINSAYPGVFTPEMMITGRDVQYGKPHPEPYLMGMERVGVLPTQCIVIENAPSGVKAAHSAGAFTLAVNTGPLSDRILYEYGADIVCADMREACIVAQVVLEYIYK